MMVEIFISKQTRKIFKEVQKYRNTLVVDDIGAPVVLLGLYSDDDDYYYKIYTLKNGISYWSCVGGFIPLISRLKKKEYKRIVNIFKLNVITPLWIDEMYKNCIGNGMSRDEVTKDFIKNNYYDKNGYITNQFINIEIK
jgi:hypothetical protein